MTNKAISKKLQCLLVQTREEKKDKKVKNNKKITLEVVNGRIYHLIDLID